MNQNRPKQQSEVMPSPFAVEWGEDTYGLWQALVFKEIRYVLRWVEAGSFQMGSPEDESERSGGFIWGAETQHKVTLTEGFWLGETTVTQAFWQAVQGENPSHFTESLENPVDSISWDNSNSFIKKLNQLFDLSENIDADKLSLIFRLPTEAEWEYACRAGTTTPFSFGGNITTDQVNYDGGYPYDSVEKGEYRKKTVPVKSLPSNLWGFYEMHGNVWEWCADGYKEDLGSEPVINPLTPAKASSNRVLRGGSWLNDGRYVRSAFRLNYSPVYRADRIGLRLALGQPSSSLPK